MGWDKQPPARWGNRGWRLSQGRWVGGVLHRQGLDSKLSTDSLGSKSFWKIRDAK